MPASLHSRMAAATKSHWAQRSARMTTVWFSGLSIAACRSTRASSASSIWREATKYCPSWSMFTNSSFGRAVSGIASLPAGSSTGIAWSCWAKWLTTIKKMSRLKTMSIMGVRSNSPTARPRLI